MAPRNEGSTSKAARKAKNKGAWTADEDMRLSQYIELCGPRRWKTIAIKAGLNRCGKSCRLRWLNYLRPNIKRGNISDEEEDLIIRLHKLLGNRWSLIAGRLPGRTDNEIKNYWNSHLSKKLQCHKDKKVESTLSPPLESSLTLPPNFPQTSENNTINPSSSDTEMSFDLDNFFDFSAEGTCALEWVSEFLELDDDSFGFP